VSLESRVFERIGIRLSTAALEALVAEALERIVPTRVVADPTRELTREETAALGRGGVDPAWRRANATNPVVRSAANYAALLATSLSVEQAASLLGIDASRIRHRLADRTVYGIKERGVWRLPAFQFTGRGLVPGLTSVLPQLPEDLHPLAVLGWFTVPNADLPLGAGETPVAPLEWLESGGDPERVAELAPDAGQLG
jgi:hypothetical protein